MHRIGMLFAALALAGCVGQPTPAVFSPQESNFVLVQGSGTVEGRATVTRDGRTVPAVSAVLLPATPFHLERMRLLYGSSKQKVLGASNDPPPPEGFDRYRRIARADGSGRFVFGGVAPGRYIVIAVVELPGAGKPQLIGLYDTVTVPGTGAVQVSLAGV